MKEDLQSGDDQCRVDKHHVFVQTSLSVLGASLPEILRRRCQLTQGATIIISIAQQSGVPTSKKILKKLKVFNAFILSLLFLKCSIPFFSFEDRLKQIKYLSLKQRRLYFDLVLVYKIFNGLSDLHFDDYFSLVTTPYALRSHKLQIKPMFVGKSSQCFNSFFVRAPISWNSLPEIIVNSLTLNVFKRLLKAHLFDNNCDF